MLGYSAFVFLFLTLTTREQYWNNFLRVDRLIFEDGK